MRSALNGARLLGVDFGRAYEAARNGPRFVRDALDYSAAATDSSHFPLTVGGLLPILTDFGEQAGTAAGHYFFQDVWAARKVYAARPNRHVDVGSRIDGFVAHVLSFMPVEVVDVRPLDSPVPGLSFLQDDAMGLRKVADNSVESLSSLHAAEHFGLGRYGDPVDPAGWEKGMRSLSRVLAPGGTLYFSVPIGRERLRFNAHRVFSPTTVLEAFSSLSLSSFAAVDDESQFVGDAEPSAFEGADMACGLFEFRKPAS